MSLIFPEILAKIQHYCAYQERCHLEVKTKLYALGYNTDTVNEVMVKLIESNYLNEERFAKAFAGGKFRTKCWGRLKIIRELKARQISDFCIKAAMKEIEEKDYINCLEQLISKTISVNASKPERQKTIQWLMGKGYEFELIQKVMAGK